MNPLIKVKKYNRQYYLLLNRVQHFGIPLIVSLCHASIFSHLYSVPLDSVRLIMLVTHLHRDGEGTLPGCLHKAKERVA